LERSDLSQTAGAARCVEVWRLKNVSKCGAGGHHKIANQLRWSINAKLTSLQSLNNKKACFSKNNFYKFG